MLGDLLVLGLQRRGVLQHVYALLDLLHIRPHHHGFIGRGHHHLVGQRLARSLFIESFREQILRLLLAVLGLLILRLHLGDIVKLLHRASQLWNPPIGGLVHLLAALQILFCRLHQQILEELANRLLIPPRLGVIRLLLQGRLVAGDRLFPARNGGFKIVGARV